MAYTFKAEGANAFSLTEETVSSLQYGNASANDSNARAHDTSQTIVAAGRIRGAADGELRDSTLELAKWSLVPAVSPAAYQKITAAAVAAGQTTRNYEFTQGFVVNYTETFTDQAGVGTFSATVRQKKDQLDQVKISGGYAAE
jgi:hypothetical protein